MRDRFEAERMFGGHRGLNPNGLWAVHDLEKCDEDQTSEQSTVIDHLDEATAKDMATRLSIAERGAQPLRQATRKAKREAI